MTRVNLIRRIHASMACATHGGPEPLVRKVLKQEGWWQPEIMEPQVKERRVRR